MKRISISTIIICVCLLSCKKNTSSSSDDDKSQGALKWVKVSNSGNVSMGLLEDGSLWSWGDNSAGFAGLGNLSFSNQPVKIFDNEIRAFKVGEVIKTDGTLYRTGKPNVLSPTYGCGPYAGPPINWAPITNSYAYKQFGSDANWKDFSMKTDNSIWITGENIYIGFFNWTGSCSGWYNSPLYFSTDTKINAETDWKEMAYGPNTSVIIGIKNNGTLWQLGEGRRLPNTQPNPGIPVQIGNDNDWDKFSVSDAAGKLIFKKDGRLFSLEASTTALNRFNPIPFGAEKWKSVTSSFFAFGIDPALASLVGIKADGTLWAYGKNADGFLGNGNTINVSSLTKISTKTDWVQITGLSQANRSFLLIDSSGDIWGWGKNDKGQLGDGTNTDKYVPTLLIKKRTN